MDKQNVLYTYMEILFNLKKGVVTYATTQMNFEDIMLSEIGQFKKAIYYKKIKRPYII